MDLKEKAPLLHRDQKKSAWITVEPVIFLFDIVAVLEALTAIDLITTRVCFSLTNTTDVDICRNASGPLREQIASGTAVWRMYYNILHTAVPMLLGFYYGSWNEMLGWKIPMMLPSATALIGITNMLVYSIFPDIPMGFLLISPVVAGLSGGINGIYCSCYGYVSDVAEARDKGKRMVILQALTFTGISIGCFIAGVIILSKISYAIICAVLLGINILILVYIMIFIKNVKSEGTKYQRISSDLVSYKRIVDLFRCIFRKREGSRRKHLFLLFGTVFFNCLGGACFGSISLVLLLDEPIAWTMDAIGYVYGFEYAGKGFMLLLVIPFVIKLYGVRDAMLAFMFVSSKMMQLTILGFAKTDAVVYAAFLVGTASDGDLSISKSFITSTVDANEKGKILAFTETFGKSGRLIGDAIFSGMYPLTSKVFKGLPLLIGAVTQLVPIAIFMYFNKIYKTRDCTPKYENCEKELECNKKKGII